MQKHVMQNNIKASKPDTKKYMPYNSIVFESSKQAKTYLWLYWTSVHVLRHIRLKFKKRSLRSRLRDILKARMHVNIFS